MSTQFHSHDTRLHDTHLHDTHDLLSLRIFLTALLIAVALMFLIVEKAASGLIAGLR